MATQWFHDKTNGPKENLSGLTGSTMTYLFVHNIVKSKRDMQDRILNMGNNVFKVKGLEPDNLKDKMW